MAEMLTKGNRRYCIQYFSSGKKESESIYEIPNAFPKFQHYAWYETGVLKIESKYKPNNDTIIGKYFYQNGNLLELEISVGPGLIYSERHCDNGQLIYKGAPGSTDKMKVTHYHCNGKMKAKFYLKNGRVIGKWQEWYDNGQIKIDGHYNENIFNDPNTFSPSEKTGKWLYYNENGKLLKKEYYKHDKMIKEVKHKK
ncbi:MAG TPA: hypothetical protein VII99_16905 [Bacteroidia bacterium]